MGYRQEQRYDVFPAPRYEIFPSNDDGAHRRDGRKNLALFSKPKTLKKSGEYRAYKGAGMITLQDLQLNVQLEN